MQGKLRSEDWIFTPDRTEKVLAARRPADISDRIPLLSLSSPYCAKARFSRAVSSRSHCSVLLFKNFVFTEIKIRVCCVHPVPPGGALRPIATYVGAGSDGRFRVARRAMRQADERKRVVPTPRRWCQVSPMFFGEATGAIKPGTPGRARISRKPSRRECRTVSAYLW
jgi:hypothetical protein